MVGIDGLVVADMFSQRDEQSRKALLCKLAELNEGKLDLRGTGLDVCRVELEYMGGEDICVRLQGYFNGEFSLETFKDFLEFFRNGLRTMTFWVYAEGQHVWGYYEWYSEMDLIGKYFIAEEDWPSQEQLDAVDSAEDLLDELAHKAEPIIFQE